MKLLSKRESRHRWHPRRNVKYYQKLLLSFWEFRRVHQEWTKFMFYVSLDEYILLYAGYRMLKINGPGLFSVSTCVTFSASWKKNSILCQGATLRGLLVCGVHDIHRSLCGSCHSPGAWNTFSPPLSSCIRHSWRAAAVGGLAETCRSVLFLGKVPALYQDTRDLGNPLAWGTFCNCKVLQRNGWSLCDFTINDPNYVTACLQNLHFCTFLNRYFSNVLW